MQPAAKSVPNTANLYPSPSHSTAPCKPRDSKEGQGTEGVVPGKPAIALVGNPGSGKSTLLNGLIGKPVFRSGLSFGTGLTVSLQEEIVDGISFIDTPGLDDVDQRATAAAEINKLLNLKRDVKIVFVATEINGRVRPEDAVTFSLILNAINPSSKHGPSGLNHKFAVVINQASPQFIEQMSKDRESERLVRVKLTGSRQTRYWCYIVHDPKLYAKSDSVLSNTALKKMVDSMPVTCRSDDTISEIDPSSFEEQLEREIQMFAERERALGNDLSSRTIKSDRMTEQVNQMTDKINEERKQREAEKARKDEEFAHRRQQILQRKEEMDRKREEARRRGMQFQEDANRRIVEIREETERRSNVLQSQLNNSLQRRHTEDLRQKNTTMADDGQQHNDSSRHDGFFRLLKNPFKGERATKPHRPRPHTVQNHPQFMSTFPQQAPTHPQPPPPVVHTGFAMTRTSQQSRATKSAEDGAVIEHRHSVLTSTSYETGSETPMDRNDGFNNASNDVN